MNCPNCGGTVPPGVNRCQKCGSYVEQAAPVSQSATTPVQAAPQTPSAAVTPKSKLAAGLFGIFLGGFGVHRFYLGYVGIGAAQLIITIIGWLTWCFGGFVLVFAVWLWGLIEGILILSGALTTDAEGQPLQP